MGKYLVSIDGHISTLLSNEGKYFYISTITDGLSAVDNYCSIMDLANRNIKVDFNDERIYFDVNWFNSDLEEDWTPITLHLIEIERI